MLKSAPSIYTQNPVCVWTWFGLFFPESLVIPQLHFKTDAFPGTLRAIFHHIRAGIVRTPAGCLTVFFFTSQRPLILKWFINEFRPVEITNKRKNINTGFETLIHRQDICRISVGSRTKYVTTLAAFACSSCRPGTCIDHRR